ncbi:MAG: hypothetical protein DDT22_01089 [candidate division WS2 bacterium]|nr:hypothetical protein [Candidatus Lithacetigena glycinireducens]
MRPIRIVLMDEVDRFPVSAGAEGDPCKLAEKRSTTFWNRKIGIVSTPTIKNFSRIEREYEASDKRKFYVPCVNCDEYQVMKFGQLKWPESKPEEAYYECEFCQTRMTDADKMRMLRHGEWRAEKETRNIAGFWLNELYSPWVSFAGIATKFLEAKKHPETLKVFVNTSLAELWDEEAGEEVQYNEIFMRREDYQKVPAQVAVLTAAVDVQGDRLEIEVVGWGIGNESWGIEHRFIYGDSAKPEVWNDLKNYLDKAFETEDEEKLQIAITGIDSGFMTQQVYAFVKSMQPKRVYATKGENLPGHPIVSRLIVDKQTGVRRFRIGTDSAKEMIYSRLQIEKPGPGYMHFSLSYDEQYFEQLTAERIITKYVKGFPKREWHLPAGKKNEALDLRVINLAMLLVLNPNYDVILQRRGEMGDAVQKEEKIGQEKIDVFVPKMRYKRSGWVRRW